LTILLKKEEAQPAPSSPNYPQLSFLVLSITTIL